MKRTAADKWFSDCVRISADYVCEACGIDLNHDRGQADCSHFDSRAFSSCRYRPSNAFCHCKPCHKKLGGDFHSSGNLAEFTRHFLTRETMEELELIGILSAYPFYDHQKHLKAISKHFRDECRRMEKIRWEGCRERLPFEPYTGSWQLVEEEARILREIRGVN